MVAVLRGVIVSSLLCLVCGQSNKCGTSVVSLVTRGRPIIHGEFPWLVALYQLDERGKWSQFCGGALLSPTVVLTAAHCLVSERKVIKPSTLRVGLGKLYRDLYRNENDAIIAYVKEVITPRRFYGSLSNFALDVGLLKLSIIAELSDYIMPVCIDWDTIANVGTGAKVYAAGWGTTENGTSTDRALAADLSYLDNYDCLKQVRLAYRKYVTHDKLCSLSINGSQVDRGDSGGPLTYFQNGRHFIVGVVSTKIVDQTAFSIFTDLSAPEIRVWLKEQLGNLNLQGYNEGILLIVGPDWFYKMPVGRSQETEITRFPKLDNYLLMAPVAFDCVTGNTYYPTYDFQFMIEVAMNSNISKSFTETVPNGLRGHSVDWIDRKLYCLQYDHKTILKAFSLDTGREETIIPEITNLSEGIFTMYTWPIVHPTLRKLYILYRYRRVEYVDLDSPSPESHLFHKGEGDDFVYSIAIDWQTNELCWAALRNKTTQIIQCKNLVSNAVRTLMADLPISVNAVRVGLTISPSHYYWSDDSKIYVMSKSSFRIQEVTRYGTEGLIFLPEFCPNLIPAPRY